MDVLNGSVYVLVVLQATLLVLVARGLFSRYVVLFSYSAVDFLVTGSDAVLARLTARRGLLYTNFFWSTETLLVLLLFVLVIVLVRQAAEQPAIRSAAIRILPIVIGASIFLPFIYGYRPFGRTAHNAVLLSDNWFIVTQQVLSFGAAIMNLVLWTALLSSKRRDPQLLTVSVGLGIAVTGQAIYYGIRILTRSAESAGLRSFEDLLLIVTHIAGFVIWCWAFRPSQQTAIQA